MDKLIWGIIKTARPRQWIKNFALFAGLIFSGQFTNPSALIQVLFAFIVFCGLSSAIYYLNDIFDVERDKQHPFKSKRPIASGILPIPLALVISLSVITLLLYVSYITSPPLFYTGLAYIILQLFYSAYFKSIILLDVIVIATGFVLRVYSGIWIINTSLNVWFLLCITSFALFLAIGKRRSELTLLTASNAGKHRETLLHYPENLLDILTSMFANSTWLTYALFAFQLQIPLRLSLSKYMNLINLPFNESNAKYLMITVPIVIYAVMRYLYIIYEKKEGESPERVLLTDTPLLASILLWLFLVMFIIYYLGTNSY